MVSRIRYPHAANQLLRGKKTLATLLALFAVVILVVWNIQLAAVVGFCGFALFGIVRWIITGIFRKPRAGNPTEAQGVGDSMERTRTEP
jgi:hypothetical protein